MKFMDIVNKQKVQKHQDFSKKLKEMFQEDQRIRLNNSTNSEYKRVDSNNTKILYEYVQQYGFPTVTDVGLESFKYAVIIAIHSRLDPVKQRYFLEELSKVDWSYFKSGYATLTDCVLIGKKQKQLYGTQVEIHNNKVTMLPVQDPKNLNKLRESMDLEPIEIYLENLSNAQNQLK